MWVTIISDDTKKYSANKNDSLPSIIGYLLISKMLANEGENMYHRNQRCVQIR